MTKEDAYNRIDAIIAKYEIDEEYVTITSALDYDALRIARKALEQQSCGDAISRQAVLDLARKGVLISNGSYKSVCKAINELPAVNPTKRGHWIDIMVGDMPAQACDQCNTFYPLAYTGGGHKYCPNCGCRMVEPQERSE